MVHKLKIPTIFNQKIFIFSQSSLFCVTCLLQTYDKYGVCQEFFNKTKKKPNTRRKKIIFKLLILLFFIFLVISIQKTCKKSLLNVYKKYETDILFIIIRDGQKTITPSLCLLF